MKGITQAVFTCLVLLCANVSESYANELYPKHINFQHILKDQDIVIGEVRAIHQDSTGYIWLGGWKSLVRYDGYQFKKIQLTYYEDGETLKRDIGGVTQIFEDSRKTIWVSTDGGILRYNREKDLLVRVENLDGQAPITPGYFQRINELPSGELLVTALVGFFKVSSDGKNYKSYVKTDESQTANHYPSELRSNVIHIANKNDVWVGTHAGLDLFNVQTETFQHYRVHDDTEDELANRVIDIARADEKHLWLGTSKGLLKFNIETKKTIKRYIHDPNDPTTLGKDRIWDLHIDKYDRVWIATDSGGINLYNPKTDRFIRYVNDANEDRSLSTNVVRCVTTDKDGDVWLGLYPEGVDFFDQTSTAISTFTNDPTNPNSLSHTMVHAITEDPQGNLWVGTDGGGLNYLDRKNNKFTRYQHDSNDPHTIPSKAVLASHLDTKGILWLGHWGGGVSTMNTQSKKITRLPFHFPKEFVGRSDKLNNGHVWVIYEDKASDIWIGKINGGLSRYNQSSQSFTHYLPNTENPEALASAWVWSVYEDSRGNFWIGTNGAGVHKLNRETGKFQRYSTDVSNNNNLSNVSVLAIFEDSKKRLWIGTAAGLNLFDYETETFKRITRANGLLDDSIQSIVEDHSGILWLSTSNGISSYNPETKQIKNYNRDSGKIIGPFSHGAGLITHDGLVAFGGVNGLRFFNPETLASNALAPPVVITKFKIYGDTIEPGDKFGILENDINFAPAITLDHKKSLFNFEFSALSYRNPSKNQYAYKLEGFDDDWLYVDNKRSVQYTNLDAGTYNFRVKAANSDGIWNEKGKSLQIIQRPPPWQTWWAYTLYFLTLVGLIAWAIMHQRNKRLFVEEQNRILEIKVQARTQQLKQKNDDIQAMLSNIEQGLLTIQEDETIHPEYSDHLSRIFETNDIANKNYREVLFTNTNINENTLDRIYSGVLSIVGEDPVSFEFNGSALIKEFQLQINNKVKDLTLDWNPIISDGFVTKLMVTVRDVTQLKIMEQESTAQKRELNRIGELIKLDDGKFEHFSQACKKFINQNKTALKSEQEWSGETLNILFRNMHTIKGNSRTYGFSFLSEAAHIAESTYSKLKYDPDIDIEKTQLIEELQNVADELAEYARVYRDVLGKGSDTFSAETTCLTSTTLKKINNSIHDIQLLLGLSNDSVEQVQGKSLSETLSDLVKSAPSIAEDLGKPTPTINIDDNKIYFNTQQQELLQSVFTHLIRNSLDHGIEMPEVREQKSKQPAGHIQLTAEQDNNATIITLEDDGQGLNITRLKALGCQQGRWKENDSPSLNDIIETIFISGVSTQEKVTDISGRGVGMDAVRAFLAEQSCKINIVALSQDLDADFIPFKSVITLNSTSAP